MFVDAAAEIGRDIADNAPESRETVNIDMIDNLICGIDVVENDQSDVNRVARRSHVESLDNSVSSYRHIRSGILDEERCQSLNARGCTSSGPITRVEKVRRRRAGTGENLRSRLLNSAPRLVT